jgi:hypothetical protein
MGLEGVLDVGSKVNKVAEKLPQSFEFKFTYQ